MSGPPLNKRIPRRVAARKFAHQDVVLEGEIAGQDLGRLAQAVESIDAPVATWLHFGIDESGFRTLTGSVRAVVDLNCQRCMQPMAVEIESELAVSMVVSDEEARQLPKHLEPWLIDRDEVEADLYAVVEDELLLALPMVVYHDYPCIDENLYSSGEATESAAPESKPNPFQMLEQLKGGKKD